ncbi:MAG: AbrB/MazE/SpoVT family DNA-binding domain-containing protein [Candidatus Micrarchaeota archaeon]
MDSKGRIVLPHAFRETLGMKEGDMVFAAVDDEKTSIVVSPFGETEVYQVEFEMSDRPGTLMALLRVLSESKVDAVAIEAHSLVREKNAFCRIVLKLKHKKLKEIISKLKNKGALKITFRKV